MTYHNVFSKKKKINKTNISQMTYNGCYCSEKMHMYFFIKVLRNY